MGSVINRLSLKYRKSVNTPDYSYDYWIINPDMSAVSGVEKKYWKITGDNVLEMDQAEKDIVDASITKTNKTTKIIREIDAGTNIMATVIINNDVIGWTTAQRATDWCILLQEVVIALQVGDLLAARAILSNVTPTGQMTQDILDDFILEINSYLGI